MPHFFSRSNFLPLAALLLLGSPLACLDTIEPGEELPLPENSSGRRDLTFGFNAGESNWAASLSDFHEDDQPGIKLISQRRTLPPGTDRQGTAQFVSSTNTSDDLFTFIKYPVSRLKPHTPYAITFEVELASNAPRRCPSALGSPGEDVFLKVGASLFEPQPTTDSATKITRLNLDKGNQSIGAPHVQVLGDISNELEQCFNTPYRIITRDNLGNPLRITTDGEGLVWLFVGTDSDYEGTTELYYDNLRVRLEPY
jgi:hypothetical protein